MTALVVARSTAALELISEARRLAGSTGPAVLIRYQDAPIPELVAEPGPVAPEWGFEATIDLNAEIAPHHPLRWQPGDPEVALLRRLLPSTWTRGDVAELWVENLDHAPAATLARIFDTAAIQLAAPGLLAFGPPGTRRPQQLQQRVVHTWYRPVVPGLAPIGAEPSTPVPAAPVTTGEGDGPALVLGAAPVAAGLLAAPEEVRLHVELIAAAGPGRVVFCPHPAMTPAQVWLVQRAAGAAPVVVRGRPETVISDLAPRLVVGCAGTTLVALIANGSPARSIGTAELLARMTPYHHPARIPLTIADAVSAGGSKTGTLQALVDAVSYVMRPQALPQLRDAAAAQLAAMDEADLRRYFRKHRLERLGLPGASTRGSRSQRWSSPGRTERPG